MNFINYNDFPNYETKVIPFEDLVENFDEVMPQIEFNKDEELIDTLKKYWKIIGNHSASYGPSEIPFYLIDFIKDPGNFDLSKAETSLRHQGSIYTQTYYFIIFIIETLDRMEDSVKNENSKIPLYYQLYYETYIFDPIFNYYVTRFKPWFIYNTRISEKYNMESPFFYDKNDPYYIKIELLKNKIIKKIINLVEEHLCRLKDNLLNKCIKEEITPIRALWLSFVPLSYDELYTILNKIENKYIRSSLFFVAGFQNIKEINELVKNEIENNAFVDGNKCFEIKETNEIHEIHEIEETNEIKEKKKRKKSKKSKKSKKMKLIKLNENIIFEKLNNESKIEGINTFRWFYTIYDKVDECIEYFKNIPSNEMNEINKMNDIDEIRKINKMNEIMNKIHRIEDKYYTFYPFYYYSKLNIYNWMVGNSSGDGFIKTIFIPTALEYKNYYKDNSSKKSYYINENEDVDIIKFDKSKFIIKK